MITSIFCHERTRARRNGLRALAAAVTAFFVVFAILRTDAAHAERARVAASQASVGAEEAADPQPPPQNANCPRLLASVVGLSTGLVAQVTAAWTTCNADWTTIECFTALAAMAQAGLSLWQAYQNWCALCAPDAPLCGGGRGGGGGGQPPAPPAIPRPPPPAVLPPAPKPAPVVPVDDQARSAPAL
jgi:hypothetical protein